ncbi:MAG: hypothetical protein JXL84_14010 [Deltaproteobacteria bacterium]|nr:hypothetical protein [Deltaproteobacteria bacterium]
MKKVNLLISALFLVCLMVVPVSAGDFDGSKPLLFCLMRVIECTPDGVCSEVMPEEVGIPQFYRIDFERKKLYPVTVAEDKRESDIERMERVDGKLMLQGSEDRVEEKRDGVGWTIAISEETGKAVLTASGEEVAFIAFGACISQ